jgi:small subunit ribosomal protein S1
MIIDLDKTKKSVSLSMKALEEKESKEAVKKYGSTDSGAKLADILGPILKKNPKSKK